MRELVVAALREGRRGLAAGLVGVPEADLDEGVVRTVGSLQLALMSGVLVQWLVDPGNAPTAENLTDALLALSGRLSS